MPIDRTESLPEQQQLAWERDRSKLLLEISNAVVSELDLGELLKVISLCLRQVIPHDAALLTLHDPESGQLRLQALDLQMFGRVPFEEGVLISMEDTPEGQAITSRQPVLVCPTVDLTRFSSPWVRHAVENGVRSGCAVPLIADDRTLGALSVVSGRENAFNEADAESLGQCASQIAIAVENALNYQRAKQERDRFEMMLEVSAAVSASLDLRELLRATSVILRKHIHHDFAGMSLYDEDRGMFRVLAADNPPEFLEEGALIPLEGTPAGLAFTTRQAVWRARLDLTEFPAPTMQRAYQAGLRSGCAVPLIVRDHVIGTLGVASNRESSMTAANAETLQLIANQIASAVENALNFERARQAEREVKRQLERERLMLEINNAVVSELDLRELVRVISASLREVLHPDVTGISLYDPETNQFRAYRFDLPDTLPPIPDGTPMPLEGTVGGMAFLSGQPVFMSRPDPAVQAAEFDRRLIEAGIRSGGVVPLIAHDKKLGFLGVGSFREDAFPPADQELLCHIANQIAIAVENALNFERAQQAEQESRRRFERERLMLEINNAVVANLALPELLAAISACLRRVVPNDFAGLALYDATVDQLRVQALDAVRNQEIFGTNDLIPLKGTGSGKAFTTRQTLLLGRIDPAGSALPIVRQVVAAGLKSSCHVPLIVQDRALGTLDVMSSREDAFSEADAELLTQVGNQIAIAVENALNFERARQAERQAAEERDRSELLLDINNAVISHLDLNELVKAVSASLLDILPHDAAGIALYDAERDELREYANVAYPGFDNYLPGEGFPLAGTAAGLVFTSGQPLLLRRPDAERFPADRPLRPGEKIPTSACLVPLTSHGRKLGILGVGNNQEDKFTEAGLARLAQIAGQVAIAVENALNFERARQAEQEVRRQFERERLMLEINNAVVTQLDLRELVRVISSCLREALHYEIAGLSLYHPETNQLRAYAYDSPDKQFAVSEGTPIPLTGSLGGKAFRSGQPVFFNRLDPERAVSAFNQRFIDIGVKSGGCVPLIAHDRKLGVLGVASFREDAFPEADQELLCHIANQIAIAVENALNFEQARQAERQAGEERDRSELLLEINNAVVSHLDLKELVKTVSASLRERLPHDAAGIALYEPELNQLREYTNVFYKDVDAFREGDTIPLEGTPAGEVFLTGRPMLIRRPNPAKYPADRYSQRQVEGSPKSACLAPLISHGRKLGITGVSSTQEERFTDEDLELFGQFAGQIAIAVENALNFERARAAEQEAKRQSDRLQLLLQINNAVTSQLELRELLRVIFAFLRQVLHHDAATIALYDPAINKMRVLVTDFPGLQPIVEDDYLVSLEGSIKGLVFTSGQPYFVDRIDLERFTSEFTRRTYEAGIRSVGEIPLVAHGRKLGTLGVGSVREGAFSASDIELLNQSGGQIAIALENALAYREIESLKNKLAEEKLYLEEEINTAYNFEEIIGSSPALRRILKQVETVAPTDSTVLIQGETGTGKELIARAIHNLSARHERTLVKLNCAAIPTGLLESELFGHEKGAFTGAIAQRIGRFELAHKGTMFLDEVGEIPLDLQPKLLRVLQEQEFERLGNARTQRVDVRLIAATNRDLAQMAAENRFRSDLYYRLNVFPITIPPLRERPEDIPLLVRFFAHKFAGRMKKQIETIPAETVAALQRYHWPGNIRELENMIERAVILTQGAELNVPLPEINVQTMAGAAAADSAPAPAAPSSSDSTSLEAVEREHILRTLRETNWVVGGPTGAAARLGMKRTTLQNRMVKLGISRPS